MHIRKANSSDRSSLIEMMVMFNHDESIELPIEVMETTLESSFSYPNHVQTFIVVRDEQVIGYIHVCFSFSFEYQGLEASVDEIFFIKEFRGLGIARAVISEVENVLRIHGAVVVRADVSDDKPWLYEFYKKLGFEQAGYRPFYKRL